MVAGSVLHQLRTRMCVILTAAVLASCVRAPAPPQAPLIERVDYQPVTFAVLPGWRSDALAEAWPAFLASCTRLVKQSSWKAICTQANDVAASDGNAVRAFIERALQPYEIRRHVGARQELEGLLTGYYEPLLFGSRRKSTQYSVPLYRAPKDLLTVDLTSVYPELAGKRVRARLEGNRVVPYYSRAEIDSAVSLKGQELVWVSDAVDAFFLQVQGSGRVQLDAGETIRVQFADVNGHPYRSIGRYLVEQGELTVETATAPAIRTWIRNNPHRAVEVLNANPSVVFFREEPLRDPNVGPPGALGLALTPGRSMAVDPRYIPLGAPVFLSTTYPDTKAPLERLVLAQDTGGAIKGILRGDLFWGFGALATERAGLMREQARMWLLWPKGEPLPAS